MEASLQRCALFFDELLTDGPHHHSLVYEMLHASLRTFPTGDLQTSVFAAAFLCRLGRYTEAVPWARQALRLDPSSQPLRLQVGLCLDQAFEEEEADAVLRPLAMCPEAPPELRYEFVKILFHLNQFDECERILEDLAQNLPDSAPLKWQAYLDLYWYLLRRGKLQEGMRRMLDAEESYTRHDWNFRQGPIPQLRPGQEVEGKRVLILHENGGAGDEMINVRFARLLKERGAHTIWRTNFPLESLFSRVEGVDRVVHQSRTDEEDFDYWVPTGGLFTFADCDPNELRPVPYIHAHSGYIEKWRTFIPESSRLRVGLRWQGNQGSEPFTGRSVPFQEFRQFFDLPNLEFYSLQRDTGLDQLRPEDPVTDLSAHLKTWEDAAAAIHHLDLVITNCTSIAHLAGALGRKTFLYSHQAMFFVWVSPHEKTPWYKDVRVFAQTKRRQWGDVTRKVKAALADLTRIE